MHQLDIDLEMIYFTVNINLHLGIFVGLHHRYLIEGNTASATDHLPTNVKNLVHQSLFLQCCEKTWCFL